MFRFFGNQRYFKLFFDIDGKNLKELSSKDHGTISHLSTVTDQLVREGLITKKVKGREVEISLTKEGKEFIEILRTFYNFATKQMDKIKNGENNEGKTDFKKEKVN